MIGGEPPVVELFPQQNRAFTLRLLGKDAKSLQSITDCMEIEFLDQVGFLGVTGNRSDRCRTWLGIKSFFQGIYGDIARLPELLRR